MFPHWWFKVWLVAVCLSGVLHTDAAVEESDERILTQVNVEAILHAQTILRRHLIATLASISQELNEFEEFQSTVDGIVTGFQTRSLDPLTSLTNVYSNQPGVYQTASIIYNLQGGTQEKKSFSEWAFILEDLNYIPPLPDVPVDIELLNRIGHRFINIVLKGLKRNLKANTRLVRDILYNYHFQNPSPDVYIIVDDINQKLRVDFKDFNPHSNSFYPSEILSDILLYIQQKMGSGYGIDHLLSSLSNVDRVKTTDTLFKVFDIMHPGDYPPDVMQAKNNITAAISKHKIPFNETLVLHLLTGYSPLEMLLGLTAKLASIPGPYSHPARAIYSHVKLKYLSNHEQFFRPRSSSDVGFLLDSFLTVQNNVNPTLIEEIPKFFVHPNIWRVLYDFDFSRYTKPRVLVLNMLQRLLDSNKLPNCYAVVIKLFLKNNNQDVAIPPEGPGKNVTCETHTLIIDPHSLINVISPDPNWKYLADLITTGPIFYDEYKNLTRRQVIQAIIQREMTDSLTFETTSKGEWPPVLMPTCLTSDCPEERRTDIINPSDIVAIIAEPSRPIVEMIMSEPIFYYQYGKYRTLGEVYKALVKDRAGKQASEIIHNTVLNPQANSPPNFIKICLEKPITCQPIIDVQSLMEIIDNNIEMKEIFPKGPFPAEKYKFLGSRASILRYILRQHYSSSDGGVLNPRLVKASRELTLNGRRNLPPVVKNACVAEETPSDKDYTFVYDIQSALEALNTSEGVSFIQAQTENFFIPIDRKKNYTKAEVLELVVSVLASGPDSKVNDLKSQILHSGPGQKPAEVTQIYMPNNILEDEKMSGSNCTTNEIILSVVDTEKIFTVLGPNAPDAVYLKSRIKSLIIPIGNPEKYSKADILEEILDQVYEEVTNVRVKRTIIMLKKNIQKNILKLPEVVQVCLPHFVVEEVQAENSPGDSSPDPDANPIFTSTATPEDPPSSTQTIQPSSTVLNSSDSFTSTSQPPYISETPEYEEFPLQDIEEEPITEEDYVFVEETVEESKVQDNFTASSPSAPTL